MGNDHKYRKGPFINYVGRIFDPFCWLGYNRSGLQKRFQLKFVFQVNCRKYNSWILDMTIFFWKSCNQVTCRQLTFFKFFVTPSMNWTSYNSLWGRTLAARFWIILLWNSLISFHIAHQGTPLEHVSWLTPIVDIWLTPLPQLSLPYQRNLLTTPNQITPRRSHAVSQWTRLERNAPLGNSRNRYPLKAVKIIRYISI